MPQGSDKRVTDGEIEAAFREADQPFLSTKEAAALIGLSKDQARNRLDNLAGKSILGKREAPGGNLIWWLESRIVDDINEIEREINPLTGIRMVDELDLPGSGRTLYRRRRIVAFAFRYLFLRDSASPAEIGNVGWVAGAGGYSDSESLYRNTLATALDQSILFKKAPSAQLWRLTDVGREFRDRFGLPDITDATKDTYTREWTVELRELFKETSNVYNSIVFEQLDSQKSKFSKSVDDDEFTFIVHESQPTIGYIPSDLNLYYTSEYTENYWVTWRITGFIRVLVPGENSELERIKQAVADESDLPQVSLDIHDDESYLEISHKQVSTYQPEQMDPLSMEEYDAHFREDAEAIIAVAAEFDRVLPDLIPDHLIDRMAVQGYFK